MNSKFSRVSVPELRKFGLVFGLGCGLIFGLVLPWLYGREIPVVPWGICLVSISLSLAFPRALKLLYVPWMHIGLILGWINTRILLGLIFYLMMTPVGVVLKVLRKDSVNSKFENDSPSYRRVSLQKPNEQMEKPY